MKGEYDVFALTKANYIGSSLECNATDNLIKKHHSGVAVKEYFLLFIFVVF
jgi:hypothetical protein